MWLYVKVPIYLLMTYHLIMLVLRLLDGVIHGVVHVQGRYKLVGISATLCSRDPGTHNHSVIPAQPPTLTMKIDHLLDLPTNGQVVKEASLPHE
ncbi:hypothetical protein QBC34DRAFT_405978 [Podospora aff. communis PSN243]|uniref:Uncharacterized protein n=1 Tax=Podospora aff. communis PSN243 TaxID=3040156 RepID=A0AAV9GNY4_9PEZI|nr:hypothetical protein QBC34DRAFT_405978 [Podospora aff. communis PSN243]